MFGWIGRRWWAGCVVLVMLGVCGGGDGEASAGEAAPEDVYEGELVRYPGPWGFYVPKSQLILVSDEQLKMLADPDAVLDLSMTGEKRMASLRQVCERAQQAGHRTLVVAFDHFFREYRPGQAGPRELMPDMKAYVERIAALSRFAEGYGLGLELSLLSPLEIGPAYRKRFGEGGRWLHYRKGVRDPKTGQYSVQLWQHRQWTNNKGPIEIEDAGARVFAFRERKVGEMYYREVKPEEIVEISDTASVEVWEGAGASVAVRVRVHGKGRTEVGGLDRVLVVQQYRTPEMDYFSPNARVFLRELVDQYAEAGVKLRGLYSDEMHIQQDWSYYWHHDHGEFAVRYVSEGFAKAFAERYGQEYADLAKYMVYFTAGQDDWGFDLAAKGPVMHVMGSSPEAIRETALLRSRYYRFLQDGVVDLFVEGKRYAEERMGHRLEARAHATWAESPTIDYWQNDGGEGYAQKYEYTSNFVWSSTVHQAAAACYDYFKWGDFLTGNGNDHAEGGWLDRNYYGLALACSTGILNEVPYSYAAAWGMPEEVRRRRESLASTFGASGSLTHGMVQGLAHRDVEVLMLYPLDLVSVEERFGSWMTQYGYANTITAAKLLERGRLVDGAIEVGGRRFTTLAAMFEPFASGELLALMRGLAEGGGRVVWSGPAPVVSGEGERVLEAWEDLFGVDYEPGRAEGLAAAGSVVRFEGALAGVGEQTILTHYLVDRIYPVTGRKGTETAARCQGKVVGTRRRLRGGGSATVLGYRPRDDQSGSLGYESRNWFEVLCVLGAYPGTGRFAGVNDNTEYVSRTGPYLACRFPNGTVSLCRHLREMEESWPGGFGRNAKQDAEILKRNPPPSERIVLDGLKVNGHTVTYEGVGAVTFRVDDEGRLVGFAGRECRGIEIDGKVFEFADETVEAIAWAPVGPERRVEAGVVMQLKVRGPEEVRIPAVGLGEGLSLVVEGAKPGSRGGMLQYRYDGEVLTFTIDKRGSNRWIYVLKAEGGKRRP